MFSSGTSNEDVFTMQLRSMMHGEDNDKVRQTVAWTDIPYFVNHTGEIANSARKARTPHHHTSFSPSAMIRFLTSRSSAKRRQFHLLTLAESTTVNSTLPQFMVGVSNGFLPRQKPLVRLPSAYKELDELLDDMPVIKKNGQPGLLHFGLFGEAVLTRLPLYDTTNVHDQQVLSALFRDYTFACSSYLMEPCDLASRKDKFAKVLPLGRDRLPANIAVPLADIAAKLQAKPFMEYALSYALYNFSVKNDALPLQPENVELIRAFHGGQAEFGFIAVHIAMVQHSGRLVRATQDVLDNVEARDRPGTDAAMATLLQVMKTIQDNMETMWRHSDPDKYLQFRSFIMGTKSQPMFPNGVVYEGVADQATFYRGESGANDSMIPTMDNLLQLTSVMPDNPLTDILNDFRSYRPVHHSQWLAHVEAQARRVQVRRFARAESNSAVLYLALLDQVREFRDRHWRFAKEYIIKHTIHPVGTGGSPIVRWLPNQLQVVLDQMTETSKLINRDELTAANRVMANDLTRRGAVQARILKREVKTLEAMLSTNADHRASKSRLNVGQQSKIPIPGHTTGSHDHRVGGAQ